MKAAIETSRDIDADWLCSLWERYSAKEVSEFMFGFLMLSANTIDYQTRSEVGFLRKLCDIKEEIEREEA